MRVGCALIAHLISLYPIPEGPGADLFDVLARADVISCRVSSVKGRVGRGVPGRSVSEMSGWGKLKKRSQKVSAISVGSEEIPEVPRIGGIHGDRRPCRHFARSHMLTSGSSIKDSNQARFASRIVIRRLALRRRRSAPCAWLTSTAAVLHASFHQLGPRPLEETLRSKCWEETECRHLLIPIKAD